MRKYFLLAMASICGLCWGASDPQIVRCWAQADGKTQSIRVKINQRGQIVPWSARTLAASKDPLFFWLAQDLENSGIEYHHISKARNGYSIVTVGTTADAVTVGVSPDRTKGFYVYKDNGSGSGNRTLKLHCKAE